MYACVQLHITILSVNKLFLNLTYSVDHSAEFNSEVAKLSLFSTFDLLCVFPILRRQMLFSVAGF